MWIAWLSMLVGMEATAYFNKISLQNDSFNRIAFSQSVRKELKFVMLLNYKHLDIHFFSSVPAE